MIQADREQLAQLLALVDRERVHLLGVRKRLLGADCDVAVERIETILAEDVGIDRLESFGAKFGRMQDTLVDKLVPALLRAAGESVGAAIDNLARMERLDLIAAADDWLAMRRLRNRLVHEYIDAPADLAVALQRACRFTDQMVSDYDAMRRYVVDRLGVTVG